MFFSKEKTYKLYVHIINKIKSSISYRTKKRDYLCAIAGNHAQGLFL